MATKKELGEDQHRWNVSLEGPGYRVKIDVETETDKLAETAQRVAEQLERRQQEVRDDMEAYEAQA